MSITYFLMMIINYSSLIFWFSTVTLLLNVRLYDII